MSTNWIIRRNACSVQKVFNDLQEVVNFDVDLANTLDRPEFKFQVETIEKGFVVQRHNHKNEFVSFHHPRNSNYIPIFKVGDLVPSFQVSCEWDDFNKSCRLVGHEGHRREVVDDLSEISEKALSSLFFPPSPPPPVDDDIPF